MWATVCGRRLLTLCVCTVISGVFYRPVHSQQPGGACSALTLPLGPDDVICSDPLCGVGGVCSCAVYFHQIPPGGSCTSMCASRGLRCTGRHGDGGANRCTNFDAGFQIEQCDETGDTDDVCICSSLELPVELAADEPSAVACSTVPLSNPEDLICQSTCTESICTCAVFLRAIAPGGSCTSMCQR